VILKNNAPIPVVICLKFRIFAEWLDQLNDYVLGNYRYLRDLFAEKLPQLWVAPHEGTYLAWVDCSALGMSSTEIAEYLYRENKVWICDGESYGEHQRAFIRINLACPHATLAEGLTRIIAGLKHI
jgi:cystathionine beta-lyase